MPGPSPAGRLPRAIVRRGRRRLSAPDADARPRPATGDRGDHPGRSGGTPPHPGITGSPAAPQDVAVPGAYPVPVTHGVPSPAIRSSPGASLVVADLEGTCTAGETWRGVGRWLSTNGRRGRYRRFLAPRLAAIPLVRLRLISRQAFRDRWIRDLAHLLDALAPEDVARMAEETVELHLWPGRRPAVIAELEAALAAGARVAIATGTYQPVLDAFIARLAAGPAGPAVGLGTPLEVADGRTTGRLLGRIGTGARKADRVRAWSGGAGLAAAYGDSLADVPLLELAADPVAVAPDADLRPVAAARGWRILDASGAGR